MLLPVVTARRPLRWRFVLPSVSAVVAALVATGETTEPCDAPEALIARRATPDLYGFSLTETGQLVSLACPPRRANASITDQPN